MSLYFPDHDEQHAMAVNCVRTNGGSCDRMSDPSKRAFVTEHGKELTLYPDSMALSGAGGKISLVDDRGLDIISEHGITIIWRSVKFEAATVSIIAKKSEIGLMTGPNPLMLFANPQAWMPAAGFLLSNQFDLLAHSHTGIVGSETQEYEPYDDVLEPEDDHFDVLGLVGNVLGSVAITAVICKVVGFIAAAATGPVGILAMIAVGAAVGLVVGIVSALQSGKTIGEALWCGMKGAAVGAVIGAVAGLVATVGITCLALSEAGRTMFVSSLIGSTVNGSASAAGMLAQDKFSWIQFALSLASGLASGAVGGSGLNAMRVAYANAAIGAVSSVLSDLIDGKTVNNAEVWINAIANGSISAVFGYASGGGATQGGQHVAGSQRIVLPSPHFIDGVLRLSVGPQISQALVTPFIVDSFSADKAGVDTEKTVVSQNLSVPKIAVKAAISGIALFASDLMEQAELKTVNNAEIMKNAADGGDVG